MGIRMASGKDRLSFRIYEWLEGKEISLKSIALSLSVGPTLVSATIRGKKNSRRVLRRLVELGCPKKFLSLPEDMASEKAV